MFTSSVCGGVVGGGGSFKCVILIHGASDVSLSAERGRPARPRHAFNDALSHFQILCLLISS